MAEVALKSTADRLLSLEGRAVFPIGWKIMRRLLVTFCFWSLFTLRSYAGDSPPPPKFSETIEDNSFFIEEAYNQEAGVVQHIFNFLYFPTAPRNLFLTFTQEWPVVSHRHQLGYTLPFAFLSDGRKGIGDVFLNYRYQLFDSD